MNWINGFLGCAFELAKIVLTDLLPLVIFLTVIVDILRGKDYKPEEYIFALAISGILLWIKSFIPKETKNE